MKKSLLSLSLILGAVVVFGQSSPLTRPSTGPIKMQFKNRSPLEGIPYKGTSVVNHPTPPIGARDAGVTETKISSSWNGFTLFVSERNCLDNNGDLGLIDFTHRQCASFPGTSGYIQSTFSKDNGLTWDSTLLVVADPDMPYCRYPSGGIYNPPGNTDPTQAYTVVSGPWLDNASASVWMGPYYGSRRFDGQNDDSSFIDVTQPGAVFQQLPEFSFTMGGGDAYVIGLNQDVNNASAPLDGFVINHGVFNTENSAFDWTQTPANPPVHNNSDGSSTGYASEGTISFNQDGSIGYFFVFGADSANPVGLFPIVYTTTDHGTTWSKLPFYDFRQIPIWEQLAGHGMFPTSSGEIKPFFYDTDGLDGLVDASGHLHIITCVYSSASDNTDSLNFFQGPVNSDGSAPFPLFFDVHQTETGWDATFLGYTLASSDFSDNWTSSSYASGVPVDARLQASISPDRQKEFVFFLDTDSNLSKINEYPDVWGEEVDFSTGTAVVSDQVNFTGNTVYAYENNWMYVSTNSYQSTDSTIDIPITVSRNDALNMDVAINHYYVNGITFPNGITGIHDVKQPSFQVSQNFPNPFNNGTEITVTLPKASSAIFKVTDMLGSTIMQSSYNWSAGTHFVDLSKKNLSAGIYYYTVTIGNEQVTRKMTIQ